MAPKSLIFSPGVGCGAGGSVPRLSPRPSVLAGELFAQAPVEQFPGIAVESVTDSSRYFVIRIEDENGAGLWDMGGSSLSAFRARPQWEGFL